MTQVQPAAPAAPYTIGKAKYAKGQCAISIRGNGSGLKDRAQRLACALNSRYSGREHCYIVSPAAAAKFERLYAAGFDACSFTRKLYHCDGPLSDALTVREALKLAA